MARGRLFERGRLHRVERQEGEVVGGADQQVIAGMAAAVGEDDLEVRGLHPAVDLLEAALFGLQKRQGLAQLLLVALDDHRQLAALRPLGHLAVGFFPLVDFLPFEIEEATPLFDLLAQLGKLFLVELHDVLVGDDIVLADEEPRAGTPGCFDGHGGILGPGDCIARDRLRPRAGSGRSRCLWQGLGWRHLPRWRRGGRWRGRRGLLRHLRAHGRHGEVIGAPGHRHHEKQRGEKQQSLAPPLRRRLFALPLLPLPLLFALTFEDFLVAGEDDPAAIALHRIVLFLMALRATHRFSRREMVVADVSTAPGFWDILLTNANGIKQVQSRLSIFTASRRAAPCPSSSVRD